MLRQMGVHSIPTFIVDGRTIVNGKTCTPVFPSLCDSYSNLHQQNPTPPMLHVLRLIDGCRRVCSVGDMVTSPWPQEKSRIAEPCLQNMAPIAEPCYIFQGQPGKTSLCSCFGSSRPRETSGAAPYSARPWAYQTRLSSTAPRSRSSPVRDFTTCACIFSPNVSCTCVRLYFFFPWLWPCSRLRLPEECFTLGGKACFQETLGAGTNFVLPRGAK